MCGFSVHADIEFSGASDFRSILLQFCDTILNLRDLQYLGRAWRKLFFGADLMIINVS